MKFLAPALVIFLGLYFILQVEGNSSTKKNGVRKLVEKHSKRIVNSHHHHHHHHHHHRPHHHKNYKHHKHHHLHHHHKHHHHHHKIHHHHHQSKHQPHHLHHKIHHRIKHQPHHHHHHKHYHHKHHHHHQSFHHKMVLKLKQQKEKDDKAEKYILKQTRRDSLPQLLVSLGKGFLKLGTKLNKDKPKRPSSPVVKQRLKAQIPHDNPTASPSVATPTPTAAIQSDDDEGDAIGDAKLTKWQEPPTAAPVPAKQASAASPTKPPSPAIKKIPKSKKPVKHIAFAITPTPQPPTENHVPHKKRKVLKKFPSPAFIKKILSQKPKLPHLDKPAKIKAKKDTKKAIQDLNAKPAKNEETIPNTGVEIPPDKVAMLPSPTESSIDQHLSEQFPQPDASFTTYEVDNNQGTNIFVSDLPVNEDSSQNNLQNIDNENIASTEVAQNEMGVPSPNANANIDSESVTPTNGQNDVPGSTQDENHNPIDKPLGTDINAQNVVSKASQDENPNPIDKPLGTEINAQNVVSKVSQDENSNPIDKPLGTEINAQNVVSKTSQDEDPNPIDKQLGTDINAQNVVSKTSQDEDPNPIDKQLGTDINAQNVVSKTSQDEDPNPIDKPLGTDINAQKVVSKTSQDEDPNPIDKPLGTDINAQKVVSKTSQDEDPNPIDKPLGTDIKAQNIVSKKGNTDSLDTAQTTDINEQNVPSDTKGVETELDKPGIDLKDTVLGKEALPSKAGVISPFQQSTANEVQSNAPKVEQSFAISGQSENGQANGQATTLPVGTENTDPELPDQSNDAEKDDYKGKVIIPSNSTQPAEQDLQEPKSPGGSVQNPALEQNTTTNEDDETKPSENIVDSSLSATNSDDGVIVDGEVSPSAISNGEVPPSALANTNDNNLESNQGEMQKPKSESADASKAPKDPGPAPIVHPEVKTGTVTQEIEDGEVSESELYNSTSSEINTSNDTVDSSAQESGVTPGVHEKEEKLQPNLNENVSQDKTQEPTASNSVVKSGEIPYNIPQNKTLSKDDASLTTPERPTTTVDTPYQDTGLSENQQSTPNPTDLSQPTNFVQTDNHAPNDDPNVAKEREGAVSQNSLTSVPQSADSAPQTDDTPKNVEVPLKDVPLNPLSKATDIAPENGNVPQSDMPANNVPVPVQDESSNQGATPQQTDTNLDAAPQTNDVPLKDNTKQREPSPEKNVETKQEKPNGSDNLSSSSTTEPSPQGPQSETQTDSTREVTDAETAPDQVNNVGKMMNTTQPPEDDLSQKINPETPHPQTNSQEITGNQNDNFQPSLPLNTTSTSDDISSQGQENTLNGIVNGAQTPNDPSVQTTNDQSVQDEPSPLPSSPQDTTDATIGTE